jgi:hypothetical protein
MLRGGLTIDSVLAIVRAYLKVVPMTSYGEYGALASKIKSKVGIKAVILDKLLGDLFIQQWKKYQPDFSSLFLNSGAHIQHHYMFNSIAYDGPLKNPDWYCPQDQDPLGLILKEYDKFLGKMLKLNVRFIIATGLHQQPHEHNTFYWRLKKHTEFLEKIQVRGISNVIPRMSRDFLIEFDNVQHATEAQQVIESYKALIDDTQLFTVDNRGTSLFVELTYPNDIGDDFTIKGELEIRDFKEYIAFVAIKNGEHNGIGYFLDSKSNNLPDRFALTNVFDHLVSSF